MTKTTPSENSPNVSTKKVRDTTHRFTVRQHARTNFLAFAYRGDLYTLFPRSIGVVDLVIDADVGAGWTQPVVRRVTNELWIEETEVRPILFGLFYLAKQPYRFSYGERV